MTYSEYVQFMLISKESDARLDRAIETQDYTEWNKWMEDRAYWDELCEKFGQIEETQMGKDYYARYLKETK